MFNDAITGSNELNIGVMMFIFKMYVMTKKVIKKCNQKDVLSDGLYRNDSMLNIV